MAEQPDSSHNPWPGETHPYRAVPASPANRSDRPCAICRDSFVVYAWFLVDDEWIQSMGECSCVDTRAI